MRQVNHLRAVVAAAMTIGAAAGCAGGSTTDTERGRPVAQSPVAITEAWRAKHEADYRRDWVTIAGLHPLKPGANTAGSAPANDIVLPARSPGTVGRFVLEDRTVRFEPAAGAHVLLNEAARHRAGRPARRPRSRRRRTGRRRRPAGGARQRRDEVAPRPRSRTARSPGDFSASRGSRSICSIASSGASSRTRSRGRSRC